MTRIPLEKALFLFFVCIDTILAYRTAKSGLEIEQAGVCFVFLTAAFVVCQLLADRLGEAEKGHWPKFLQTRLQKNPGLPIRLFGWIALMFITIVFVSSLLSKT